MNINKILTVNIYLITVNMARVARLHTAFDSVLNGHCLFNKLISIETFDIYRQTNSSDA